MISVEGYPECGIVVERDHADLGKVSRDVQSSDDVDNKVLDLSEVILTQTTGGIQYKHDVSNCTITATCTGI